MREIKFKARVAGTDGWIVGLPHSVYGTGIDSIQTEDRKIEYIRCDTLCEFTGIKTVNESEIYDESKEIYEGDIYTIGGKTEYIVTYDNGMFIGISKEGDDWGPYKSHLEVNRKRIKLIGNIHD